MRPTLAIAVGITLLLAGCASPGPSEPGSTPPPADGDSGAAPVPVAAFSVSPAQGSPGTAFAFDASTSQGRDLSYAWNFGDGATGQGRTVSHTYPGGLTSAVFGVTLTVRDPQGRSDLKIQPATIGKGSNAQPVPMLSISSRWIATGGMVNATGMGSRAVDGGDLTYLWGLMFHGDTAPGDLPRGHMHMAMGAGGKADYKPEQNGFDSPAVDPGMKYTHTLAESGLYLYHCHPHPWMTGAVLVQPGAAKQTVDVEMWQAQSFLPLGATVGPGSSAVWHNVDATWHTVSLSAFFPMSGIAAGGASHAFRLDKAGVYEIALVVKDAKGAMNATSQLVKVTAEAPPTTFGKAFNGSIAVAVPNGSANQTLHLPFAGNLTFTFGWSSPSATPLTNVRLDVFPPKNATPALTVSDAPATARLAAGDYNLVVTAEAGAQVNYTIDVAGTLEPDPGFESGSMAGMHM